MNLEFPITLGNQKGWTYKLNQSMQGKVALLTGGNSGIGKATAVGLAKLGASLTLVSRDKGKAEETKEELIRKTRNDSIELIIADLLLQNEVRRVAAEFQSSHSRLDVLINNAGTSFTKYAETEDGIERTMAVNYFAPFLLTNLLTDSPLPKNKLPKRLSKIISLA